MSDQPGAWLLVMEERCTHAMKGGAMEDDIWVTTDGAACCFFVVDM